MAKLTITHKDDIVVKTLLFRNKRIDVRTRPNIKLGWVREGTFLDQYNHLFEEVEPNSKLSLHLHNLDYGDEKEVNAAVQYLTDIENDYKKYRK